MSDLVKSQSIEDVAKQGAAYYERNKDKFEPKLNGKFLVLQVENKKEYVGNDTAELLEKARQENPGKLFYVIKIGYGFAETLSRASTMRNA